MTEQSHWWYGTFYSDMGIEHLPEWKPALHCSDINFLTKWWDDVIMSICALHVEITDLIKAIE